MCYGLIVHLRLLSTPPRGDAVTVSYGMPEHSDKDLHLADSMQLQAHEGRTRFAVASRDDQDRSIGPVALR